MEDEPTDNRVEFGVIWGVHSVGYGIWKHGKYISELCKSENKMMRRNVRVVCFPKSLVPGSHCNWICPP